MFLSFEPATDVLVSNLRKRIALISAQVQNSIVLLFYLRRVCLPFVPATDVQVSNVLKALSGRSGNLIDIGG